jgi:hypothetical protein
MAVMGWEIPAGAAVAVVLAVVGWIWRLATRLAGQEGRITAAATAASNASARATVLEQELASHREHVAAEYLSKDSMKEITEAINRLGDRLDGLFLHFMPKP